MSYLQNCSVFLITAVLICSAENKSTDYHKKCTQWEEQHCIQGNAKFHYCTAISAEEWKVRLFGPNQSKLFCECREGFTIPMREVYEDSNVPTSECVPCQEEKFVYFGHNIEGYDPLAISMTLDDCRKVCYKNPACNFWAFNRVGQKCYLKSKRGHGTPDIKFVSGLKNCSGPQHFLERKDLSHTLPLLELFHPTGERTVLQGIPAMFGPRLAGDFSILGYFSGTFLENSFCDNLAADFRPKGEFAIARRGQCNFLQKTQVAQLAGFKGLIILDDESDTKFHRIISAKEDQLKSSFVKIPTLFLRRKETETFHNLMGTGKKFLVRMSGSDNFSRIRDDVDFRFPDAESAAVMNNEIDSGNSSVVAGPDQESSKSYRGDTVVTVTQQDSGFSPVAIIFIASTSGLVALALLTVFGILCRKLYRRRTRTAREAAARCQGSVESNSNGTIFQTVSSGNVGSLESLARWIGSENFQTAGSDSAEMAVILSSVECPVCYEAIWPPKKIFQCTKGHILCETCLGNPYFDQRCPSCRESFTSTKPSRNLALENLFSTVLHLANLSKSQETASEEEAPVALESTPAIPLPTTPSTTRANIDRIEWVIASPTTLLTPFSRFRFFPSSPRRRIQIDRINYS